MLNPATIAHIRELLAEASVFEDDLEESFILGFGEMRSREDNRWLARRALAEAILERENKRKSAKQQAIEKKRRQKRRRARRQREKMLDDKHAHAEKKAARKPVEW